MNTAQKDQTILIIEDDVHIREMLSEFLQQHNYTPILAQDGLQGMSLIENEHFDLVIVDIKLPFVSGIGLIQFVKQLNPELPTICITGYGYTPKNIAELENADQVLTKPFDLKDFLNIVQDLLQQSTKIDSR